MELNDNALKILYKAHVQRKMPSSREDCPPPEKLIGLVRGQLSEKESTILVDHITRCSFCCYEFEFVVAALRKEEELVREMEKPLRTSEAARVQEKIYHQIFGWLRYAWDFFSRSPLQKAFLVLVLAMSVVAILRFALFQPPEKYRLDSSTSLELFHPVNEKISRSLLVFEWKKVSNADYYLVELFDPSLSPIWKSDRIFKTEATLPREIAQSLTVNSSYFWMVSAFTPDGEKILSPLEEFILKD